jgi:hypothetical protein
MLCSSLLPILTLISPIASLSLPTVHSPLTQEPLLQNVPQGHFRDVQPSDFPAIATLVFEAFKPSAAWHYLMPDLSHHEAEVRTCLLQQIEEGWKTHDKQHTLGKVITVPHRSKNQNEADEEGEEELAVSIAIWHIRTPDTSLLTNSDSNPFTIPHLFSTCTPIPSTNLTRAASFIRQTNAIEEKYFSSDAYPDQLYLNLLATHPDWDGNGFGARQVEWGMNLSRTLEASESLRELGMPVTLLATPAGWVLYDSLGFEGLKNATVEMVDGDGELWYEVMEWDG